MSNLPTIPGTDGWDDAAREADGSVIRGTLLKFADWRWTAGKAATPVAAGTRLVAVATRALWQRWQNGRPAEERFRQPGQQLPERDDLGFTDENTWELGVDGKPTDPWRNTRLVYLVDPRTGEAFTFSTSSFGGRRAVSDLGDQIARMRSVHPDATAVVELDAAAMPTKYGTKSKPVFKIVGWKTANGEAPVEREITPATAQKTIAHLDDDAIPF